MNFFEALVSRSLLGTGRDSVALPAAPPEITELLQVQSPEQQLLRAAAACTLQDRAGRLSVKKQTPQVTLAIDERPTCSPRASSLLKRLLDGTDFEVLHEWIVACDAAGVRPPPHALPLLFDTVMRDGPSVQRAAIDLAGSLGRWLCGQNPAWSSLIMSAPDSISSEIWQTGSKAERLATLRAGRETDANAARDLLASTFAGEPAGERAAFLETLETGLSPADEPFLEKCLADRSKEVRAVVASLLSRISGSAFVARMIERVQPLLNYQPPVAGGLLKRAKPGVLSVKLPPEADDAMKADGLGGKPAKSTWGPRQAMLFEMLVWIPPSHWSALYGASAEQLLAADASEHRELLTQAWTAAAITHQDADWAAAVARHQLLGDTSQINARLLEILPESRINELARFALKRDDVPLPFLLQIASAKPMTVEVAKALITAIPNQRTDPRSRWESDRLLPSVAMNVPGSMAGEFQSDWDKNEKILAIFSRTTLDRFLERLILRARIQEEFRK